MMNILDRYIAKYLLRNIALSLFLLVGISFIIKFMEKLKNIDEHYTLFVCFIHVILLSVKDVTLFFSISCLLGVLLGLGALSNTNELSVMQTASFSKLRIGWSVIKTMVPLIIIIFCISELVVPKAELLANKINRTGLNSNNITVSYNGIWTKEKNQFINVQNFLDTAVPELKNLKIYTFNNNIELVKLLQADSAEYRDGKWILQNAIETFINKDRLISKNYTNLIWDTTISPSRLHLASFKPENLQIADLLKYKKFLKETGQNYKAIELGLWNKLFQPISIIVMILLGMSFIFGILRTVPAGSRVMIGICCGLVFYVINELASRLSLVYQFPTFLASLLPSVIFFSIAMYLLIYKKG